MHNRKKLIIIQKDRKATDGHQKNEIEEQKDDQLVGNERENSQWEDDDEDLPSQLLIGSFRMETCGLSEKDILEQPEIVYGARAKEKGVANIFWGMES